jgi:hypothetical protein
METAKYLVPLKKEDKKLAFENIIRIGIEKNWDIIE